MSLGELLEQGGWPMAPLYLCSVIALAVFVRKLVELRAARLSDLAWLEPAVENARAGKLEAVARVVHAVPHPAARAVAAAAVTLRRRPDRAEAEAARVGSLELQRLEQRLRVLSFVAQAAPLLGLLGTVIGMVDLFLGLQGTGLANVDASRLSSGIWKALLTTAAGLCIAVPTLAAYAYLTSRTDRVRLQISDAVQRLLTAVPDPRPAADPAGEASGPPARRQVVTVVDEADPAEARDAV